MKITDKNFDKVVENFRNFVNLHDKQQRDLFYKDFNQFLEDLKNQDAFGTEGQLDPRKIKNKL